MADVGGVQDEARVVVGDLAGFEAAPWDHAPLVAVARGEEHMSAAAALAVDDLEALVDGTDDDGLGHLGLVDHVRQGGDGVLIDAVGVLLVEDKGADVEEVVAGTAHEVGAHVGAGELVGTAVARDHAGLEALSPDLVVGHGPKGHGGEVWGGGGIPLRHRLREALLSH